MTKKHDLFEYKRAKERVKELEIVLKELDLIADSLYNLITYSSVWRIIEPLEETRLEYYIQYMHYKKIINNKGMIDG